MKNSRKYIVTAVITAVLIAAAVAVPQIVRSGIPSVTAERIVGRNIADTVECRGVIEAKSCKNLYTAAGIMVDKVFVKNGQRVSEGDLLFSVNKAATVSLWAKADNDAADEDSEKVSELLDGLLEDYFTSAVGNIFSAFSEEEPAENEKTSNELLVLVPDIVTASTSGVVANLAIEDGVYADGSTPLLQICDTSAMFVRCELAESFAPELKEGLSCKVMSDSFDGSYAGTVREVSPVARASSGGRSTVGCVVEIDFPDGAVKAGCSADATIILSRRTGALTVPYSALNTDADGDYVWVLYGSRPYRRSVETGIELDDCVEIVSGLESDCLVVSKSDKAIEEGCLVNIKSGE